MKRAKPDNICGMLAAMRAILTAVLLGGWAGAAFAQLPEGPYAAAGGRVTVAGEVSATIGETDDEAYFNFTDYEHNALRLFRGRVFGEWRASTTVSLLAEVRFENRDTLETSALYVRH